MGPHVNAYTSFDETVYQFELPTNREGIVEKGLQALADFAGGMLLTPTEIDKERGVVIEEWRGGLGAGIAAARPADPGALLPVQVRRTPADRKARDPEVVHARSAARPSTRNGTGPIAWQWSWSAMSILRRWRR